jgi:hypothetical protein
MSAPEYHSAEATPHNPGKLLALFRPRLLTKLHVRFAPAMLHLAIPSEGQGTYTIAHARSLPDVSERKARKSTERRKILFYESNQPYYECALSIPSQHERLPSAGSPTSLGTPSGSLVKTLNSQQPSTVGTRAAIALDGPEADAPPAFQAHKFLPARPDLAERIRAQPSARDALETATSLREHQRADWFDVNVRAMERVLELKFQQHPRLAEMLLSTGDAELVEDSPVSSAESGVGRVRLLTES